MKKFPLCRQGPKNLETKNAIPQRRVRSDCSVGFSIDGFEAAKDAHEGHLVVGELGTAAGASASARALQPEHITYRPKVSQPIGIMIFGNAVNAQE